MKWDFYHFVLLTALVEGTGTLLTLYWVKFNPSICNSFNHVFTCQVPPFWLGLSIFLAFAAGVIIPASGFVLSAVRMLRYSRKKMPSPISSPTDTLGTPSVEQIPRGFTLYILEVIAFCLLVATGIGLYIVHWLYMGFYSTCFLVNFSSIPIGVNCNNIFANALFVEWVIATIVFSLVAGIIASLVSVRKFSKYRLPKKGQSYVANTH